MGIPRVLEALESNDWASFPTADEDENLAALERDVGHEDGSELDPDNMDFGIDKEDFEGLRQAIWEARMEGVWDDDGEGEMADKSGSKAAASGDGASDKDEESENLGDEDIRKVEEMMRKLQAVRDTSAGLPEDQRKRLAAKAVGEVMKEL